MKYAGSGTLLYLAPALRPKSFSLQVTTGRNQRGDKQAEGGTEARVNEVGDALGACLATRGGLRGGTWGGPLLR
jgi:hypothetical protein